ncbi:MAG: type I DNA topoisomerase [Candidatus Coatesbacteria bacterium]|nr:MAG: type I DNA topoisomerase [Candidatus Coatesbacteria bacterium]
MGKKLVIVESNAKVKTIAKILGRDYVVKSCQGHVTDLPKSSLGVDVADDFKPTYEPTAAQEKTLKSLAKAAAGAEVIYLATDPDREGEAIAYHLAQHLDGKRARRISFNEITPEAVRAAVAEPRELDLRLVAAQQARRILDRLVGYQVSPVLWKKVTTGLSAGRVQSVAVRLICEREEEIENFVPEEYWTIGAEFEAASGERFEAALLSIAGETLMAPRRLEKYGRRLATEKEAAAESERIRAQAFNVTSFERGEKRRSPPPPFTTSKLQQAAARQFGFTGKKTMAVAQTLYEGVDVGDGDRVGLITYMRTDSVRVARGAVAACRRYVEKEFGAEYLPPKPRAYRSRKGAQEAHEAIRPTDVARTPERLKGVLTPDQLKLYGLIYRTFVASQMADAVYDTAAATLEGGDYLFRASAQALKFPGFLRVSPRDDVAESTLPTLTVGEGVDLRDVTSEQHFTKPPPRYNDASLVQALEEYGIGRPSTYAPTVATIIDRQYVERRRRTFYPTELGKLVNALLVASFPDIFNVQFTAQVESQLDAVEEGDAAGEAVLREFYDPFAADLARAEEVMDAVRDEASERTDVRCPKCDGVMEIKWGRFGKYLRCENYPDCAETMNFERDEEGKVVPVEPEDTGEKCDKCGGPMVIKRGRYGEFLACGNYPECKNTRPLRKKVDAKCPQCGGQMVQRRGKRGKPFYGCEKYPDCDFTSNAVPVNEPCPKCGSPYLLRGRKYNRCPKKECGYRAGREEE